MRKHYADAFEAWDRWAAANIERRREYSKTRDRSGQTAAEQLGTVSRMAEAISRLPHLSSSPRPPLRRSPPRCKLRQRRSQPRNLA